MNKITYLIICIIFFACESDPIKSKLHDGIEFEQYTFPIDNFLITEQTDLQNIIVGESNLLYSGYILDTLIDGTMIKDTSRAIISVDLFKFSGSSICTSVVEIESPKISLYSSMELSEIFLSNEDSLNIKIVDLDYTETDPLGGTIPFVYSVLYDSLNYSIPDSTGNELIIDLPDSFINNNETTRYISEDLTKLECEEGVINLLIEYLPDETNDTQYIEWYSSDFALDSQKSTPKINLDYIKMESVDTTEYQFSLDGYLDSHSDYYYIDNESDNSWSTTYFMNIEGLDPGIIESSIDFSNLIIEDPLINTSNLSTKVDLATLRIELNDNPLAQDSISQISLALEDVIAYIDEEDPSGDDYDGVDSTLTEGNAQYDVLYNSIGSVISSEEFNDFGLDNCENQYEKGYGQCCEDNEECIYNNGGLENNNLLNWVDNDNDGLWSPGDSGEEWIDFGADGCLDEYETGDVDNPCSDTSNEDLIGTDPNGDNYNIDPNGDNYNSETGSGFENNGALDWTDTNGDGDWDEGEGEQWLDYGLDGLPNSNDPFEDDMIFQNFEPYFDYGEDNIPDENEPGFCNLLNTCSENNLQYDVGELADDVGEDGCSDEYETGDVDNPCSDTSNEDLIGTDPNGDNYNIDPNGDNYNSVTDSGFENNGELDWADDNNNQIWDEGEIIEEWFDYGLDQTENSYEQYLPENQIIVSLSNNEYQIDIDNFNEYSELDIPITGDNQVALWISSIIHNTVEDDSGIDREVYDLILSIYSERKLDGVKFRLDHPDDSSNLTVTWAEDYERNYSWSVSYVGEEVFENKLFQDVSLYPFRDVDLYSESLHDSLA